MDNRAPIELPKTRESRFLRGLSYRSNRSSKAGNTPTKALVGNVTYGDVNRLYRVEIIA